jgi:hypothetical protein
MHQKLREIFYRLWKLKSATDAETDTTDGEIYFRISAAQRASSLSQKDPDAKRSRKVFMRLSYLKKYETFDTNYIMRVCACIFTCLACC